MGPQAQEVRRGVRAQQARAVIRADKERQVLWDRGVIQALRGIQGCPGILALREIKAR